MKGVIGSYGQVIVSTVIGVVALTLILASLSGWVSDNSLGEDSSQSNVSNYLIDEEPVIIVTDSIVVPYGSHSYNFEEQATAYSSSDMNHVIPVTVYNKDSVDVDTKGFYEVVYSATNDSGHTFSRSVLAIVR